jgi:hypothetical protein
MDGMAATFNIENNDAGDENNPALNQSVVGDEKKQKFRSLRKMRVIISVSIP